MDVVGNCGCDKLIDPDPTKFDSSRHYYTCHLYKEDVTFNDLFTELLGDIEVVDSSSNTIQLKVDTWMTKLFENENDTFELSKKINESLSHQLQAGVLNEYEYADL